VKAQREYFALGKDFLERGIKNNPDKPQLYEALARLYSRQIQRPRPCLGIFRESGGAARRAELRTNVSRHTSFRIVKDASAKRTNVCARFTTKGEKGTSPDFDQTSEISRRETERPAGAAYSLIKLGEPGSPEAFGVPSHVLNKPPAASDGGSYKQCGSPFSVTLRQSRSARGRARRRAREQVHRLRLSRDVVGYNANPHECVEHIREMDCPIVKGNHDEQASLIRILPRFQ